MTDINSLQEQRINWWIFLIIVRQSFDDTKTNNKDWKTNEIRKCDITKIILSF